MEDNGWSPPPAIGRVVAKLRFYLGNSSDSNKLRGTKKMLDLLEDKLKLLHEENLQRVSIDREEEMAAWLRQVKEAAHDAEELVKGMEAGESATDILTWFRSDSSNLLRMKYTIGRLVSVCTEGESILGMPYLDEDVGERVRNDSASLTPDHAYVVGRDKEIAMILDMILDGAHFKAATSLESWASADSLQISQKGWIIEALRNINLSQQRLEDAVVSSYQKEMGGTIEYTRVYNNTVSEMMNPMVIPMVGISGVGKTTLAQFVLNEKRVQEHFQCQSAWVYCTDNIRKEDLMTKILVSLQPQHKILAHGYDLNSVQNQLQSFIEGKRFLLVLDDVSDEIRAIWGDLRSVLSKGAPGSVVLVTTQLYGAASFMGTTTPIFLDPLQYDDLWKLFKHHAFSGNQSTEALESMGREIAERLHGLPLAATMIGVSLRNYLDEVHWDRLLKSWWWSVSSNSLGIHIAASLGVCYCELPAYLRQCLVYCSIFPRNYIFGKYELIQMWTANGFVELNNTAGPRSREDVAAEWFDELVKRCFLRPTIWEIRYVMHDLVRDFAIALTSNEYLGVGHKLADPPQSFRHLSIEMDNMDVPWAHYNIKNLRSLMLFGGFHDTKASEGYNTVASLPQRSYDTVDCLSEISYDTVDKISEGRSDTIDNDHADISLNRSWMTIGSILERSTSLRLLNLSNMRPNAASACSDDHLLVKDYVASFAKFITRHHMLPRLSHLRYLDFSYSGITELPDSLCTLCNLQVLGLRGCRFTQLPRSTNSLISLRHLHAGADTIALIHGIGELTKLQDLHEFRVKAEDGHRIAELRNLNDIRGSLCVSNLEMLNDPGEVLQANIAGKRYLTDLELKWSDLGLKWSDNTRTLYLTAEKLSGSSPLRNLQVLKLFGYPGVAIPDWMGHLEHIRVIEISSCQMLRSLPPLEQLEHLQKLKFHDLPSMKNISSILDETSNVLFRSLEELSFEKMYQWESWTYAGHREFIPNLQKLQIIECYRLREVPLESLGSATKELLLDCRHIAHMISMYLPRLTSLTRLEIHYSFAPEDPLILPCAQLRSLEYLDIKNCIYLCIKGGLWFIMNLRDLRICVCFAVTTELDEVSPHEEKHSTTTQIARDMHSLTHLTISLSDDPNNILTKTPFLRTLCIDKLTGLSSACEQWLQQLTSLEALEISYCNMLPSSLSALSSMKKLNLKDGNMDMIPPNTLPSNLKELQIEICSIELEARCQKRNEKVWPKEEKIMQWRWQKMVDWRSLKVVYGTREITKVLRDDGARMWLSKKREEGCSSVEELLKSAEEEGKSPNWTVPPLQPQVNYRRYKSNQTPPQLQGQEDKWLHKEEYHSSIIQLLKRAEDKWLLRPLLGMIDYIWSPIPMPMPYRKIPDRWVRRHLYDTLSSMDEADEQLKKEKEEWLKIKEEELLELKGKDWPNIAHVPYIRVNGEIIQNLYT